MKKFKLILPLLLVGLLAVGLTGCSEKSKETSGTGVKKNEKKIIKLGYPGTAKIMEGIAGIAQDKRFFNEELNKIGYEIEYMPFAGAGPAVNEALASKKIQFSIYADLPGILLKSKGADITLLGIAEEHMNATLVVRNDSSISSINQLKGKKVGFAKGTYMQKYLLELLKANKLTEKDFKFINVTTEAESSLLSGDIDALVLPDIRAQQLIITKKVAKEIVSARNNESLSAQNILVGVGSYIKDNPDVPVAIEKALLRARDYFKDNNNDSYNILTKSGLDIEAIKKLYDKKESFPIEITDKSIKRLEETQKFLIEQKLLKDSFDVSKWVDNSYYEKAIK